MTYTTPSLPLTLRLCVACCSTCSIPVFFHLYFLGAAVLGVHSTGAVSSLPLPQPTTVAAKAAATVMPYLTVRPQRTVKLASFAPRSAPALHAFARPRRRSPLVGGLTLPASRVLHSFSPSRRLPALPPRFQGTRGFHPPVCAAPYPPGCGATSSLLLSNICIQLLWRRCVGGDSARRRGVTDVSPSRWVASLQSLPRLRATFSIATCFALRTRAVRWFSGSARSRGERRCARWCPLVAFAFETS